MSSSPIPNVPSVQSRHPRHTNKQAEIEAANDWLTSNTLILSTCPINAVTKIIATETSIGKTILSKYDPPKLQNLYGTMRSTERIHTVDNLWTEVRWRQERAQKRREVLEMVAAEQSGGESKATEVLASLETARKKALGNTEELLAR